MSVETHQAISDEVSRHLGDTSILIQKLYHQCPSDREFINQQLAQLVRDIDDLVQRGAKIALFHTSQGSTAKQTHTPDVNEAGSYLLDTDKFLSELAPDIFSASGQASGGLAVFSDSNELEINASAFERHMDILERMDVLDSSNTINTNAADPYNHQMQTISPMELCLGSSIHDLPAQKAYQDLNPGYFDLPHTGELVTTLQKHKKKGMPIDQHASAEGSLCTKRSTDDVGRRQKLSSKSPTKASQRTWLTSDLYLSIASADSVTRLELTLLSAMQPSSTWNLICGNVTAARTFEMLDKLDSLQHYCSLWRRILLYRFVMHRDALFEAVQERRRLGNRAHRPRGIRKPESEAIDLLTREIFPQSRAADYEIHTDQWRKDFEPKRKRVLNRLHTAKNWKRAVQCFGLGILALIPLGDETKVQNHRYETLHDADFGCLLSALKVKADGFVTRAAAKLTPIVQKLYDGEEIESMLAVRVIADLEREIANPQSMLQLAEGG